ncbi:hypothetical protein IAR55_000938 [Kwoniella newhampshirensis]|uniref:AGC protein kinase n=1 Tax=Kwoniella newhampshirensis TaxID=1651941 RepID=A0AAW0Z525_9TREE
MSYSVFQKLNYGGASAPLSNLLNIVTMVEETMPPIMEESDLPDGQFVLGLPISARLDKERYSYTEEEGSRLWEEEKAKAEPSEDDHEDDDLSPLTPEIASQMAQPRRSLFQEHSPSRRSSGSASPASSLYLSPQYSPVSSPRRASESTRILPHRSSLSSLHSNTPPASPSQEYRCRVSLDATPIPPSIEFAGPTSPQPGSISLNDDDYDHEPYMVAESSTSRSGSSNKTARFSLAPPVSHSGGFGSPSEETSRSLASTASVRETSPPGTEDGGHHARLADRAIRSVPGVIGLGEGWAGGPQRSDGKRSWFRRGKESSSNAEEDPLALWSQEENKTSSQSPLKDVWNRSKRSLISRSTTALDGDRPEASSRTRGFFSRSLVNLLIPNPSSDSFPSRSESDSTAKRYSNFAASDFTLSANQSSKHAIPPSPSLPLLSVPSGHDSKPRGRRRWTEAAFARSEADLSTLANDIPCRSSSLQRCNQGLRPPWRPQSLLIAGRPHTPQIREVDEVPPPTQPQQGTESSTSLGTPRSSESSHLSEQANNRPTHALVRTATFGGGNNVQEMRMDQGEEEPVPGLDTIAAWARGQDRSLKTQKPLPRTPSPPTATSRTGKRKSSLLARVKTALSASRSHDSSVASSSSISSSLSRETFIIPLRKASLKRKSKKPSPVHTPGAMTPLMEPLKTSTTPSRPSSSLGGHHHKSWRDSSFGLLRLSKLTEQDEENENNDIDIASSNSEDRTQPNSLASRFREHRRSTSIHLLGPLRPRRSQSGNTNMSAKSPAGSTNSGSVSDLRDMTASLSMPSLTKLSTTNLNLHVNLDDVGEGLDLEDILDEAKRQSIVQKMAGSTNPTPAPLTATVRSSPLTKRRSLHGYSKSSSSSFPLSSHDGSTTRSSAANRIRHSSMQVAGTNYGSSSSSTMPRGMTIPTFEFETSPNSTLGIKTPKTDEITLGGGGSFFSHLALGEEVGLHQEDEAIPCFSPPKRDETKPKIPSYVYTPLKVPQNGNGMDSRRISMNSFMSKTSFDENDVVVNQKAIRVTSLTDMQQKASVLSMNDLEQRGLWSGVPMRSE